jgi:hypothetical protein
MSEGAVSSPDVPGAPPRTLKEVPKPPGYALQPHTGGRADNGKHYRRRGSSTCQPLYLFTALSPWSRWG